MRFRILPYRQGSKGARSLADALGGKVLKLEGSKYKPKAGDVLINWGNTTNFVYQNDTWQSMTCNGFVANLPETIKNASNKLSFFNLLKEKYPDIIPKFWTNKDEIPDDAFPIVCRTVLAGHSGDGIVIAGSRDALVVAPLYVGYVKKKDEYRVHLGKRKVFDEFESVPDEYETCTETIAVQRKARRADCETPNWQIRNHHNGFVFVRSEVNPPASVLDVSRKALEATGLDFGAVDVIWNAQQEKAYVLEINTAPGLEGQTVTDYAKFFQSTAP